MDVNDTSSTTHLNECVEDTECPTEISDLAVSHLKDPVKIQILQLIRDAQLQHGLRHGDYQRYRSFCSRRLHRIRRSLHFTQTQGPSKHRFVQKKVTTDVITDAKFFLIPLFSTERAWAYAMQLKAEANTEPRKRFHMRERLRKAVHHAQELIELSQKCSCEASTKLEIKAYSESMKGSLFFELQKWKEALTCFTTTKTVYTSLMNALPEDRQGAYPPKLEEISASLRYCEYSIGDMSAAHDLATMRSRMTDTGLLSMQLDELLEQTRSSGILSEITWRGRSLPIQNDIVRRCLLGLQEREFDQISDSEAPTISLDMRLNLLESCLKSCTDAVQATREEVRSDPNYQAVSKGQSVEGRVSNALFLHSYMQFLRHVKLAERASLILLQDSDEASKKRKPQDFVRLYDTIIQNLNELPRLPGLQDDLELEKLINTYVKAYSAQRCFHIADFYFSAKKYLECIILCQRVITLVDEIAPQLLDFRSNTLDLLPIKITGSDLVEVKLQADSLMYTARASDVMDVNALSDKIGNVASKKVPLGERLNDYCKDSALSSGKFRTNHLYRLPPKFEAMPSKPLYFDLVVNSVQDFPSLDEKLDDGKNRKHGLSGIMKGWFSWGKK